MTKKIILALSIAVLCFLSVFNAVFEIDQQIIFIMLSFLTFAFVLFYFYKSNKLIVLSVWDTLLIVSLVMLPLFSYYKFGTFVSILVFLSGVLFYITFLSAFTYKEKRFMLKIILLIGIIESVFGFLEYFVCALFPKSATSVYLTSHSFVSGARVSSFFQYPNAFAGFLLMPFFISMYFLHKAKVHREKILLAISSGFILFVLYLASSRGAYIILLFSMLLVLFFERKQLKTVSFEFLTVFAISIVFYALNYKILKPSFTANVERAKVLVQFFAGEANKSLSDRIELAKDALNIFIHHPLFGTGFGTFKDAMLKYRIGLFFAREPHSMPFRLLAESGIIGFIAFFGFYIEKFMSGIKRNPYLLIPALSLLLHTFLDLDFAFPFISLLIFAGFALAMQDGAKVKSFIKINPKTSLYGSIILAAFLLFVLVPNFASALYLNGGNSALNNGNINEAITSYALSVKLQPANASAHSQLAYAYEERAYSENGKCEQYLDGAIKEYQKASALNTLSFIYPLYEGSLRLLKKDPLSVSCFKKSFSLNPRWKPILSDIALSEAYTGTDLEESVKFAKESLQFNPPLWAYKALKYTTPEEKDSDAYTALGFAYSNEKFFDKALTLNPENEFAHLGKYFTENDELSKLESLRKALNANTCLLEARKLYFSEAPLINVKNVRFSGNRNVLISVSVIRNRNIIKEFKVFVFFNEKKYFIKSFKESDENLHFTLPENLTGKFKIKIEGVDKNGFSVSGIISPEFDVSQ